MATNLFLNIHNLGLQVSGGKQVFAGLTAAFGLERTGLVGANGSGKSCLLRVLAGVWQPSEGRVQSGGRVGYLAQQGHSPDWTVAEAMGIGRELAALDRLESGVAEAGDVEAVGDRWGLEAEARVQLQRVGLGSIEPRQPLRRLSGGQVTRVQLAGLLLSEPDWLLLDEPTNHLDREARRAVEELVSGWRKGLITASHDRQLLQHVDRIAELSPMGLRFVGGNWAAFEEWRRQERAGAEAALESAEAERERVARQLQRERERRDRRQSQGRKERDTGSQGAMAMDFRQNRAERGQGRARELEERLRQESADKVSSARARLAIREELALELPASGLAAGKTVLRAENLTFQFPGAETPLLRGFSITLRGPERVAIAGPNGSGKSTLLRLLTGDLPAQSGTVERGVEPLWLDQMLAGMEAGATVLEQMQVANPARVEAERRLLLARFGFRNEAALRRIGTLSGGEKMRAALACTLGALAPPLWLVLDEPTNHLDLDSVEVLEAALRAYDGALLMVSHDEVFLEGVGVDRVVEL